MTLNRFFIYSLIIHLLLGASFAYVIPLKGRQKEQPPFFARLVAPDEFKHETKRTVPEVPKHRTEPATPLIREPLPFSSAGEMPADIKPPEEKDSYPAGREAEPEGMGLSPQGTSKKSDSAAAGKGDVKARKKRDLFDPEIIAKHPVMEKPRIENSITFDTKEFRAYGYMQRLRERIEGIWKYPPDAVNKGIYGDLKIEFTIKKNGRLDKVELVRTSGYSSLDDAAIKALKDAEPYWPLPEEWGREGLTVKGHFIYSLYGTYIR